MTSDLFQYSDHLGFFNPFYFINRSGKLIIRKSFEEIVSVYDEELEIDPLATVEVLNKNFMLGDRTIAKRIFRTPWMAQPNDDCEGWVYHSVPKHEEKESHLSLIAENLFRLLCEEIQGYVKEKQTIGLLLSGGMDSRIVAGVLDYLLKEKLISAHSVTAYTWGNPNSRDVVYAQEIARRLNWKWKHYVVNPDDLWENFKIAGHRGCEYSGIHLHAIPQIAREIDVEVLLAGSYGDSVGRAEYSGKHVTNLIPLTQHMRNFGSLINFNTFRQVRSKWESDINKYHTYFPESFPYAQLELDYQLHYMRRMLNPCIGVLNDCVPTFQAFTSPKVFGYMWSLNPKLRNDSVYLQLINNYMSSLSDIPWARTGMKYGVASGMPDSFNKKHHSYESMIQNDLLDRIEAQISTELSNSLLNKTTIVQLLKLINFFPYRNSDYLERLSWLVSFSFFLKKYQFPNHSHFKQKPSPINAILSNFAISFEYIAAASYRKVKMILK